MPNDPIERLSADIEIYDIPQVEGQPPMRDTYLHVRLRQDGAVERATLGLPAYQGKQGERGAPGAIHQGGRTTNQLEQLRGALDVTQVNWAYRNTDTNDMWLWTGETFLIYPKVFATPGPTGPAAKLQPGVLRVGGVEVDSSQFGVRVVGTDGKYSLGLDLPKPAKGDPGPTGPSGSVIVSQDINPAVAPTKGAILQYIPDPSYPEEGRLEWTPMPVVDEYVVPPTAFPNMSKSFVDSMQQLCTIVIPAKSYRYRFDFTGGIDIKSPIGYRIDAEIRMNDAQNGELVGLGKGQDGEGWRELAFRAHSEVMLSPELPEVGSVPPGTQVTLYVMAIKRSGIIFNWEIRRDRAQLRVRLMRVRG